MFELSDRRERYPDKCATEFAETVRMQSNMSVRILSLLSLHLKKNTKAFNNGKTIVQCYVIYCFLHL